MTCILIRSTDWTVQAAVYSVGDITHGTVLSSGQSGQFNIVSGGPSPEVSVTIINRSTLSTIGGTIFKALTPGVDVATTADTSATATDDTSTVTTSKHNSRSTTPTPTISSISDNQSSMISSKTSPSGTILPSAAAHDKGNGLSVGTTIGIAVGVILVIVFLVLMAGLYFLTKRQKTANKKKVDDQAIQLTGRLGSHETFEKDFEIPTLKYGEDDGDEEILSGRVNTAFESHNVRGK